jgi:guanosine-3',5'-bis(diphosphate) 3'-pyrophosphohydrolase
MQTVFSEDEVSQLLTAVKFAADKHSRPTSQGVDESPYINHRSTCGDSVASGRGVRDIPIIIAAVLHDTIEDTKTMPEEIEDCSAKLSARS